MTIGEKIATLRQNKHLSQEEFAEILAVSRQSVSKWEVNQAAPHLDKVVQMCKLFGISADDLLDEGKDVSPKSPKKGNKYFGTDGFRGEVNVNLTALQSYKVGRFLGWYYSQNGERAKIIIGKDTRRSSYCIEYGIIAGITASGGDAYMLHVTTTPCVSFVTRQDEFDCGIMITASHNPFYDNGIKVINRYGEKLEDAVTEKIEEYLDRKTDDLPLASRENIGAIVDYACGRNRYIAYLISLAGHSYKNMTIGLDCANGASFAIAKGVFEALGAKVMMTGNNPNGVNINKDCGSTHIENLCKFVKENHLDLGYAFDGDADRLIAVDENGNEVDGDKIIFALAIRLKNRDMLDGNKVVTTIMSNSGLIASLEKKGIGNASTDVGDRFVYEEMQKSGYMLGGEQSGHIIIKKYATTGDALLTAIMLSEEICENKTTLGALVKDVTLFPQKIKNVRVKDKMTVMNDKELVSLVDSLCEELKGHGRVLLRKSGTEPVIRIMAECETEEKCDAYIGKIYDEMVKRGYEING